MGKPKLISLVKDLVVYNLAFDSAMKIFHLTKKFPKEEMYSLTDQIRRSSRSVSINIREGYAKKKHEKVFRNYLIDALGSSEETRDGWNTLLPVNISPRIFSMNWIIPMQNREQ